jgi:hypothetical protein
MTDPATDLPMPDVEIETPTSRRRRDQATSVQIGRARVAYLDALAADRALPGRPAALLSIWTRSALATDGRLALPALPPPRRRPTRRCGSGLKRSGRLTLCSSAARNGRTTAPTSSPSSSGPARR